MGEIMETGFSNILCVVDMNVAEALDRCLTELALPEVFIQRAKQISLIDKQRFLGLRSRIRLVENRALIYRLYVPSVYQDGIMRLITEAGDLKTGGRGSIFAHSIGLLRGAQLSFDTEKLEKLCGKANKNPQEEHVLVTCIVSRGSADSLVQAVLELGICVPVVFYGTGVGLRDKLGLMRITIPAEKETMWFIVPKTEAELVEKTLISRARLDVPGQGFLYKCFVHAPTVNLRVRQGKRVHAATMEQVISALDEVRGSSDWRRLGPGRHRPKDSENNAIKSRGLFFIGEEEEVDRYRLVAMENGARGATLYPLEMRSYSLESAEQAMESHSRELCDIIVSPELEEKLNSPIAQSGLFDRGKSCVLKKFNVEMPEIIHRAGK